MILKRWFNLTLSSGLLAAALTGCAGFFHAERPAWRKQAELACLKSGDVRETAYIKRINPIDGPGICGADFPLKVAAVATDVTGSVPEATSAAVTDITPPALFTCPMVAGFEKWMADIVQPAAYARFNDGILEIKTFGSYSCRPRNNQSGAALSEHGFANAVDIAAFVLGSGRIVTVEKGWHGAEDERGFLREVMMGACSVFGTVLGPGSNAFHYNHFHLDMARHSGREPHYCRPLVDVPPRPGAEMLAGPMPNAPRGTPAASGPGHSLPPIYKPNPGLQNRVIPNPPEEDDRPDQEQDQFDPKQYDLTSPAKPRPRS